MRADWPPREHHTEYTDRRASCLGRFSSATGSGLRQKARVRSIHGRGFFCL